MPAYRFLSDEWLTAVRRIVDEQALTLPEAASVTMNLLVTDTPFASDRRLHITIHDGMAAWHVEHVDRADLTLTTDYETARAVFMTGDPQAALQAFMEGKVKIQGDLTKLMAAQAAGTARGGPGLAAALAEITE